MGNLHNEVNARGSSNSTIVNMLFNRNAFYSGVVLVGGPPIEDINFTSLYTFQQLSNCAMTIGEQSVRAIMPKRSSGVSGPSEEERGPIFFASGVASELQPTPATAAPNPTAAADKNRRRFRREETATDAFSPDFGFRIACLKPGI